MNQDSVFAERLYEAFSLKPVTYMPMQTGYRNHNYPAWLGDGRMVNLIIYKSEADIKKTLMAAHYVAEYLAKNSFPVRRLADMRILRVQSARGQRLAALYDYLPGETIPWEAYTGEHIKALGGALSTMHALLAGLDRGPLPLVIDRSYHLLKRMEVYFSEPQVQAALARKLGLQSCNPKIWRYFERVLEQLKNTPGQPLHLDFVRGNILFSPNTTTITGVLDFEKAAFGPVIFDIARTLAFLLVDCKYKEAEKVRKYFLQSGYQKRGAATYQPITLQLGKQHVNAFEALVDFFLLYDLYKFLRHNPYEALADNEHYVRTRDLLLSRRRLAVIAK